MKIGFIDLAGPDFPGGCEKYFCSLANHISKKNSTVFFHSRKYVSIMEWLYFILIRHKKNKINYANRSLGGAITRDLKLYHLLPFSRSNKMIKKEMKECHSIYVKNEFQDLLLAYLLLGKKLYREKTVVGVHSAIFIPDEVKGLWGFIHNLQYESRAYRHLLSTANKIHIPNSAYETKLSKKLYISKRKIKVIHHPIDWSPTFKKSTATPKFRIMWMGRLTQQKGVDYLIELISAMSSKPYFKDLEFTIAGQGEEDTKINKIAKKFSNIYYLGFVKDTKKIYTKADLAIVTSYFEVFPYSVLEPQSFGLPVVSTNVDGARDIITNKSSGVIAKNKKEFISGIENFFFKKSKSINNYNLMRKKNFVHINKKFNRDKIYLDLNMMLVKK